MLKGASRLHQGRTRSFKPLNDDDALFTRLPNGEGVSLSKKQVVLHGAEKLADLKSSGVDVVIMLCTGVFPEWQDSGSSFSLKNSGFDSQGVHADRQDMCFCTSSETVC